MTARRRLLIGTVMVGWILLLGIAGCGGEGPLHNDNRDWTTDVPPTTTTSSTSTTAVP